MLGFVLSIGHSVGLDKCIMACIHHYGIIQCYFTALKVLYLALPIPPFLLSNYWQPLIILPFA